MGPRRLFLAIALPSPIKRALASLVSPLPDVRWMAEDQLHLTLRFLGDVEEDRIETLTTRLSALQIRKFLLPLEGVGLFPPKGSPRVLWCGVGSGHPRLHQLRQRIDDAVLACGIAADLKTFHPHVTLARCGPKAATAANAWLRKHQEFAGPSFAVEAFELFASELRPAGPIHTLLNRFPLETP
jgi:2'-5' RNA ligase